MTNLLGPTHHSYKDKAFLGDRKRDTQYDCKRCALCKYINGDDTDSHYTDDGDESSVRSYGMIGLMDDGIRD
jgi:hypothetical protein